MDYLYIIIVNIIALCLMFFGFYSSIFIFIFLAIPSAVKYSRWSIKSKNISSNNKNAKLKANLYFKLTGISMILFVGYSIVESLIHTGWGKG